MINLCLALKVLIYQLFLSRLLTVVSRYPKFTIRDRIVTHLLICSPFNYSPIRNIYYSFKRSFEVFVIFISLLYTFIMYRICCYYVTNFSIFISTIILHLILLIKDSPRLETKFSLWPTIINNSPETF